MRSMKIIDKAKQHIYRNAKILENMGINIRHSPKLVDSLARVMASFNPEKETIIQPHDKTINN